MLAVMNQKFVDGRGASFIDVILDTSGSIVGILLKYNIFNKISRKTWLFFEKVLK